jgi:hypothetical protein
MTTVRSVLGKSTVSGLVVLMFSVTACGLAWTGKIDGPTFVGLLALPLAYLFRQNEK